MWDIFSLIPWAGWSTMWGQVWGWNPENRFYNYVSTRWEHDPCHLKSFRTSSPEVDAAPGPAWRSCDLLQRDSRTHAVSVFVVILVEFDKYWIQNLRRAGLSTCREIRGLMPPASSFTKTSSCNSRKKMGPRNNCFITFISTQGWQLGCLSPYPWDGTEVSESFADEKLVNIFSASLHCLPGKLGLHTYSPDVHLQLLTYAKRLDVKRHLFPGKAL